MEVDIFKEILKMLALLQCMIKTQGLEKTLEDVDSMCKAFKATYEIRDKDKCIKCWEDLIAMAYIAELENRLKEYDDEASE